MATVDYESAKRLRDTGFPQNGCKRHINRLAVVYWTREITDDPVYPRAKELKAEINKCFPADDTLYRDMCSPMMRLARSAQCGTGEETEEMACAFVYIWLRKILSYLEMNWNH